jgi:hypothetical protein
MTYLVLFHHRVHRAHCALAYSAKREQGFDFEKAKNMMVQLCWQFLHVSKIVSRLDLVVTVMELAALEERFGIEDEVIEDSDTHFLLRGEI